ncbi:hypothetical protein [Ancylobacter oerskovii]|uniref:Uncharacterized protein n=1 Tax=Ancylobacter oerskovii TaxID=459519 RepID=A0ABW4YX13_9HYPH|nr:hypothetical protein [Ancylobacter oerskovii]MBS7542308.1 hypothetical protein [Ancylobacter oerskovii]
MISRHVPGPAASGAAARAGIAGTAFIFGAALGLAAALPLAALAFTPERMPAPMPRAIEAPAITQSPMVNRTAKGPRLDLSAPAAARVAPSPAQTQEPGFAPGLAPDPAREPALARDVPPVPQPALDMKAPAAPRAPAGAAPGPMPRGCLSALGGIRPNIPTENLTVCMADISTID